MNSIDSPASHDPDQRSDAPDWVQDYFASHLGERMHCELLPGLRSLTTAFTIEVGACGMHAVAIEGGCIERCERVDAPSGECHVTVATGDFASIVSGERTPQSLFVRRRLSIAGNPLRALSAAFAMEEFFRRFPYHAASSAVQASNPSGNSA